jgi:hypothetical protein
MNVFTGYARERLSGSDHYTAVTTDEQRYLPGFLKVGGDLCADEVPCDPRPGPTSNRRDRMMGKIAGDLNIAVVERLTAGRSQAFEQMHVAIRLGVVFIAGV